MPEWVGTVFFFVMVIGFPAILVIGGIVLYFKQKKEEEFWEDMEGVDDDTLDEMTGQHEKVEG